ncbi:MAG TPA: phosphotransferase [Candidatus Acidoferrales bacterium]|nr:phosphotransferase [Candidatus Acidoferrales bacterium]
MQAKNPILDAMLNPQTYPESTGKIDLIQTHISFVFLTDKYVYKVKKPVNFGFLDFSTLDKRKLYCDKELQLNRRLCPDIYLEVVPINKSNDLKIKGAGETVEYALKMKRLPQESIMTQLLQEGKIDKKVIDEIATIVAKFHSEAQTNAEITEIGGIKAVKFNWDENFAQTTKYQGQTLSKADYDFMHNKINNFMTTNKALFEARMADKRVRDCHGDLHSGNIFVTNKIYIFDAIEFNDRFRYGDVTADVAFLAMDLDYQNRSDLADYFIAQYQKYSKDPQLKTLLPFYKCYRAYVRGKVISFRLDDPNIKPEDKKAAIKDAEAYFKLALQYAKNL